MIVRTMPTSHKSILNKRARIKVKSLSGKKVGLSKVADVWKDYVQLGIIDELIKYGKIQIDKNTKIEIIGRKNLKAITLKSNGERTSTMRANPLRAGYTYKVVLTDTSFKGGKLIFSASASMKKQVSSALKNTNNYYKIAS